MRFEILGPAKVVGDDGAPVSLGGPRVRGLLTLLALDAGRVVGAEHLVDHLYGERPPEGVANALQSQVSRLRRALGRDRIEFHPAGYRLAADPEDVDARRFERLAGEGRRALAAGDARQAARLLREALELWRGRPLADVPRAEAAAAGLAELRLAAVEDRVQAELELGRHRELAAELRQLTAAHPLRERLHAQLMRALYGSGRQAEALAVYQEARRLLGEELGVEPGAELSAAQLAVLRAEPALGPAAGVSRQGVRAQLTSFVGRSEELSQVGTRLRANRLVTLIGTGGAGKTRLAMETAERAGGDVCVVELAPVTDGADVPKAALAALDLHDALLSGPERPMVDPVARLTAALAGRELLLVLDNCEHLVAAVAELADRLLAACPGLRVLATSREALGITGESILPVAPLRLPPSGAPNPLDYPAVRLFADRAAAVRPGFVVGEDDLARVVSVCRALDGLPLAIELAAARLRTLSVADVADRLDDRFRLLARGSRTALPRHQTLRAVVAWSWDLLDESEQLLAARLTVFVNGATPAAAERVCGLPEETLFALAEKSLVEVVDGRYRMLETIRAYCAERLAEAGETEAMREAHAVHYAELVAEADPHLRRSEQLEWLALLDDESDDMIAAVRWAAQSGRGELGLRLLANAACYWWMRGHRQASARLAHELLATMPLGAPDGLEEEYTLSVLVAAWSGEPDDALRGPLDGLRHSFVSDYMPAKLEFLTMMRSMFTGPPGDVDVVLALLKSSSGSLPPWQRALTTCGVAFMLQDAGEPEEARAEFERALAIFRELGERWGITLVLAGLGDLAFEQGDHATAHALAEQTLQVSRELGSLPDMAESLCRGADAVSRMGDLAAARAGYLRAAELSRRAGSGDTMAWAQLGLGEVAMLHGEVDQARACLAQAEDACPDGWYSMHTIRERIRDGREALARLVSER
ncbi:BTAD domain-containing putative transcriptional regulator [Nonomuraea cavernae]|uniref:SARP family transcriptional regulator n=1 Tax=Nonomuraea cavernae TaxID=2045107 RepID=A0A917YYH5_9ACTN|nr:BTAD domain-containing putative transcriptional regulator [Nonomuraea cavernae]MCA2190518.1 tetratricopeptide repeat protein [Nonomuraea cavernae]GGO70487.1 SARP family transcriptional regulator [Nonomuraea cavernae]